MSTVPSMGLSRSCIGAVAPTALHPGRGVAVCWPPLPAAGPSSGLISGTAALAGTAAASGGGGELPWPLEAPAAATTSWSAPSAVSLFATPLLAGEAASAGKKVPSPRSPLGSLLGCDDSAGDTWPFSVAADALGQLGCGGAAEPDVTGDSATKSTTESAPINHRRQPWIGMGDDAYRIV